MEGEDTENLTAQNSMAAKVLAHKLVEMLKFKTKQADQIE